MTNPKGTAFERPVADYLAAVLQGAPIESAVAGQGIDRAIRTGAKDKGDIRGLYVHGQPLVVECKNVSRTDLSGWVREAEIERGNADALAGIVIHKRRGKGLKNIGEQYVTMTVDDLLAILMGERPER